MRDHILFVGMMGSGKTTIGRRLAERLSRPFIDSDAQVEAKYHKSVAEIFASSGEAAFRAAESEALAEACASSPPAVIAVAGGAVLSEANRQEIAQSGRTVWLRADPATIAARVGDGHDRPLLNGDVAGSAMRLDAERRPLYAELTNIVIDVDDLVVDEAAEEILERLRERVNFDLGDRSYDVIVGPGTKELLGYVLPERASRAVIVTQESIGIALDCPIPSETVFIPEGEKAKTLATIEDLCRFFAQYGLSRSDVVIGLGGGVVTDVSGFAASCYHRGAALVNVATTLLAQVDAAFGGKTGVNLPEGKNLVGAFFQPSGVICDTDLLASLPAREWRSGLGEMAKYAFLGIEHLDEIPLVDQVARCVALKAEVTIEDERESGRRAILNYGHTLAHALEAAGFAETDEDAALDLRHGEAVAIGLIFAARLAEALGRIDGARAAQRHLDVVTGYGLPSVMPVGVDLDELIAFMERDKKATSGLSFVLDGPKGVELVHGVDPSIVKETLALSASS